MHGRAHSRNAVRALARWIAALALRGLVLSLLLSSGHAWAAAEQGDRSTPRRVMTAFLLATEARDYEAAGALLDTRSLSAAARKTRGPELAAQLHYVLEHNVWVEPDLLSDDPQGSPGGAPNMERIGSVRVEGVDVPIMLARLDGAPPVWAISSTTVARIPRLYEEHGPGWLESRLPRSLSARVWGLAAWQWIGLLLGLIASYAIGRLVTGVATRIGRWVTARTRAQWDDELVGALRRPSRFLAGLLALRALLGPLHFSAAAEHVISRLLVMVFIFALAWTSVGVVRVISNAVERRAMSGGGNDADHRQLKTQVRVLRRVIDAAIGIVAIAAMLTQFEVVRTVGVSLLASAGVAGVVLGFAAQRTFGSLIAGIQLSFTQPILIGDVVVVEKEQGTIEEVTLTFVVVRTWDERRLIVPMTRFLEQPFENWTKGTPELHGTVFLHVDWRLPVDELRKELDRIVEGHELWDGRTKTVAVTATTERAVEVRVLVSSVNAPSLWALRVHVREQLVAWLQRYEGGKYLPHVRVLDAPGIASRVAPQ